MGFNKDALISLLAGLFAAFGLGFGFYLLSLSRTGDASVCFTVAITLLLFTQLNRLEFFKGFGIEAKVHQLNTKIHEAEQLSITLKALTASLAQVTFETISRLGRPSLPIGRKEVFEIEHALLTQMRAAKLSEAEISKAVHPLRLVTSYDLMTPAVLEIVEVINDLDHRLTGQLGTLSNREDVLMARRRLQKILTDDFGLKRTVDLIQVALDIKKIPELSNFTPSDKFYAHIADHDHYVKTGQHKRPEQWISDDQYP